MDYITIAAAGSEGKIIVATATATTATANEITSSLSRVSAIVATAKRRIIDSDLWVRSEEELGEWEEMEMVRKRKYQILDY